MLTAKATPTEILREAYANNPRLILDRIERAGSIELWWMVPRLGSLPAAGGILADWPKGAVGVWLPGIAHLFAELRALREKRAGYESEGAA